MLCPRCGAADWKRVGHYVYQIVGRPDGRAEYWIWRCGKCGKLIATETT